MRVGDVMQNNAEFTWENFTYGIGNAVQEVAEQFGIENTQALYTTLMEKISFHCGGSSIYIPKGASDKAKANARNRLIIKEFNGFNHAYLAQKYGVSLQWIYRILKNQNKEQKCN